MITNEVITTTEPTMSQRKTRSSRGNGFAQPVGCGVTEEVTSGAAMTKEPCC